MTTSGRADDGEPIDPDIDIHRPEQRRELARSHGAILAVISAGGALGALARYGLAQLWPTPPGGFPWATFATNVIGCFLIGILMVAVTEIWVAHPLVRPFLGVGILGGFTTFSTYANDTRALLHPDTMITAFTYFALTLLCALPATLIAVRLARWAYEAIRSPERKAVA
ncbi:fluoride efflux transporter CrcB [Nocardia seriolae]|nr:fluoride efflux transporter CrcB [Nocardia seriolae]MTJ74198.1 fluoride efflux transporter CrcB [Nocardia seriolae]MTJ87144.1 fluoride efflux transporter CrcB [Nocardia seriolae]MTK31138.1 fluoride efflux transporter CrcB [Nocardia seriolae]MTK40185.1 fluoride efflux transporter CrcB [Nocardia seriolae]